MTTNFFSPLSFVAVFGSGIRDPRSGIRDPGWVKIRIRDPGSGINIPDPQHCLYMMFFVNQIEKRNLREINHTGIFFLQLNAP